MLRKPFSVFLGAIITVTLMLLMIGIASGDGHVITDEYNTVAPDGYWTAEVDAEGHQRWSFDLAETRNQNVRITIEEPPDASLVISIDGVEFGHVHSQGDFTVALDAGTHHVTVENLGDVRVRYGLYLGFSPPTPGLGVAIDIKPGGDANVINPKSAGVIPVAILGSDTFDVGDVDVSTLAFGPDGAEPAHASGGHTEDVNEDGFTDLVSHYRQRETGIASGDEQACLAGATLGGILFDACDDIRTP